MQSKASSFRIAIGNSALGLFGLAVSETGIAAIVFGDSHEELLADLQRRLASPLQEDSVGLAPLVRQVAALIAEPGRPATLTLDPKGSPFQRQVWTVLGQIPAGSTASYGEVARLIGAPRAVRAVAQACGANPIAVAIPCHRVVRSDGSAGGYRWGAERKAMLLRAEAAL